MRSTLFRAALALAGLLGASVAPASAQEPHRVRRPSYDRMDRDLDPSDRTEEAADLIADLREQTESLELAAEETYRRESDHRQGGYRTFYRQASQLQESADGLRLSRRAMRDARRSAEFAEELSALDEDVADMHDTLDGVVERLRERARVRAGETAPRSSVRRLRSKLDDVEQTIADLAMLISPLERGDGRRQAQRVDPNQVLSVEADPNLSWVDGDGCVWLNPDTGVVHVVGAAGGKTPHAYLTLRVRAVSGQHATHVVNLLGDGTADQLPGAWIGGRQAKLEVAAEVPRFPSPHCGNVTTPGGELHFEQQGSELGFSWSDGQRSQCGPLRVSAALWTLGQP